MRTLTLCAVVIATIAFVLPASALELAAEEPGATVVGSPTQFSALLTDLTGVGEIRWDFGDGERTEFTEGETEVSHNYAAPGHYPVIVVARDDNGFQSHSFVHTVHRPLREGSPQSALPLVYEPTRGAVITANTDNDSITLVDVESLETIAEIPVLDGPVTVAIAPDGRIWVVHRDAAAVAIVDPTSLKIVETFKLPYASQPMGVVFSKAGDAYRPLMALGEVILLDGKTGETHLRKSIAPFLRGVSMSADGTALWVTRFISGEGQGEVFQLDPETLELLVRHELLEDTTTEDSDVQGRGLPNYLFSIALTPDGVEAWIPGKKDNMSRGLERDGLVLTQDNTVRPMIALIDLESGQELIDERIDLDDRNLPRQVTFSPLGDYAMVTLFGSNQVEVRDTYTRSLVTGLRGGKGPVATLITENGRLFVLGDHSRTLVAYDIGGILSGADQTTLLLAEVPLVENEALTDEVLFGKQLFSNADDPRMASEGYMSCGSCHLDGFEDGRVWAFADRGEGLRNTTSLLGRRGTGHGPVHWSGNFDEIQDFEAAIRSGQGGLGFMSDVDFFSGTRSEPWGDPKAGMSPELDAIAAYVAALDRIPPSPYRNQDGTLTSEAISGQAIFLRLGCESCHSGDDFTNSQTRVLYDVGTLTADSGSRLGEELVGLDTPTLLGIWQTAPYLHDGSAATLLDVLTTQNPDDLHGATSELSDEELSQLVAYLLQLEQAPADVGGSGGASGMGGDSGTEGTGSSEGVGGNQPAPNPDTRGEDADGGCSCRVSQGPAPRWPALPLLLVGLVIGLRRRQKACVAGAVCILSSGGCASEDLASQDASGGSTLDSSGGVEAAGGAGTASGGGSATGGVAASGGSLASGGAPGSGGTASGGESATGGASNPSAVPSGLPVPPTGGVSMPSGTAGGLRVLDWAGFKAAYSFTFDDGHSSQLDNYDKLETLDVPMTFYLTTNWVNHPDAWKPLAADGHEIGNHSVSHPGTASAAEIDNATKFIEEKIGVTARSFAAPNGNNGWVAPAQSRMLTNRLLGSSIVAANGATSRHSLPCYIPREGASAAEMKGHVDSAHNASGWGLSLVHSFQAGSSYQPVSINEFTATVEYAKAKGDMWLDTVLEVSAYWIAQKIISDGTPMTNGAEKTWTWTLPEHFPPGRYVRVTVDGGSLSQEGVPLAWDNHGYYEVPLDVGTLTLSP